MKIIKIMKNITAAVLAAVLLTACTPTESIPQSLPSSFEVVVPFWSKDISAESDESSEPEIPDTPPDNFLHPETAPELSFAKAEAFYSVSDGKILYSENEEEIIAPASLTKIMTASVALKFTSPDDIVTIGSELDLVLPHSSLSMIQKGQKLSMYDLLTAMLLPSGNDAAYSVAAYTGRVATENESLSDAEAVEVFCEQMNTLAWELRMYDTHYQNPDGMDDPLHYTTAVDLLKIAKYAYQQPVIREITAIPQKTVTIYSGETYTWRNSNRLLYESNDYYCADCVGMKTGSTDNAKLCLVAVFIRNNKVYISVTAGFEDGDERYERALTCLDRYA